MRSNRIESTVDCTNVRKHDALLSVDSLVAQVTHFCARLLDANQMFFTSLSLAFSFVQRISPYKLGII